MCDQFVHIHTHTEYSLLDGANRIPDLVKRAKQLEMPALAISDHGVMFGAMEFYYECQKQGIRPILGMEAYVAPNGRFNKDGREENQTYHLLLLAKNEEGYRNLCKLHTAAALEGFYYKPRIDHDLLREHSAGLIGTSACLGSEICKALSRGDEEGAERIAGMYRDLFEEDSFYIEFQDHRLKEQAAIKGGLQRIAKRLKLPTVVTNDAHYLCKESHDAHDVLLCIGTGALLKEPNRLKFQTQEFYLKSGREMSELFSDMPEAVERTIEIADRCNVNLGKQRAMMPDPDLPPGMSTQDYLRHLAEKGLKERVKKLDEEAWERLGYELDVIKTTGFDDYFLLVREFAQFTRNQGIAFGVRGSAAGSLVSYCIGITDVDPLEYDLTFERFLNPERVSMPDIDMDFEDARRDEVIKWVTQRYGESHVAQIVTFGTLGAKAAIKDAGRVMGYAPQETDRLCKTVPNKPGISLTEVEEGVAEFRDMVAQDPNLRRLLDVAKDIEGTARHAGVHAAGVVISKEPLSDHIPLYRGNDGQPITAFEMKILEKLGLLKMDFLGLSNLTVLARAVQNIEKTTGQKLDVLKLPLDDQPTYEMLGRGETVGVFQLESGGMRRNIIELKPQSVRELAAMVALYRPGPMEHIPTYVDSKFGRRQPIYLDERMRPILEETYGVIVYQDQVLKLVQTLAGFSLGKADILRRAMGKKEKAAMDAMQVEFMQGADHNGVARETAERVWELLLPFAGYAFNKAHAVCYALIAYQTAYLKANYPVEYMAALLAVYHSREDKVTTFIEECRRQKISVLQPDVNRSLSDFSIEGTAIRFGMAAIKGVGEGLVESIIKERESNGPYSHLYEFCERVRTSGLNRSSLEALIKAGALDAIDRNRRLLLESADGGLSFADQANRNRLSGQESLFGGGSPDASEFEYPTLKTEKEPMDRRELLAAEKEVMGIYVSDHPLRGLERTLRTVSSHPCSVVPELEDGASVSLAGVITGFRTIITKSRGEKMATFVLEDFSGQASCVVYARTYVNVADRLEKDKVVSLRGTITHRERRPAGGEKQIEVRVEDIQEIQPPQDVLSVEEDDPTVGVLELTIRRATRQQLEALRKVMEAHPGSYRVHVFFDERRGAEPIELLHRVDPSNGLIQALAKAADCRVELRENRFSLSDVQGLARPDSDPEPEMAYAG